MKKFLMGFFIALRLSGMHKDASPDVTLIIPPSNVHQRSSEGIPFETQIGLIEDSFQKIAPNNDLVIATQLLAEGNHKETLMRLNTIAEITTADNNTLIALNEALKESLEKSGVQQNILWDSTHILTAAGSLCLALDKPSYQVFNEMPEIACALYSAAYYLMYQCCRHAMTLKNLEALKAKIENLVPVPPLYTITLPPPQLAMEYQPSDKTHTPSSKNHAQLERTEKSAYDGCRNRDRHEK